MHDRFNPLDRPLAVLGIADIALDQEVALTELLFELRHQLVSESKFHILRVDGKTPDLSQLTGIDKQCGAGDNLVAMHNHIEVAQRIVDIALRPRQQDIDLTELPEQRMYSPDIIQLCLPDIISGIGHGSIMQI